ncbi:MAG: hypothetical protein WAR80_11080 [Ferruginibacter sp.]
MKTKNIFAAILFGSALSFTAVSNAQSRLSPFKKGSVTFSAGVGIGNEYNSNYYNSAIGTKAVIEAGIWQAGPGTISLGAQAGGTFSNGGGAFNNYKAHTLIVAGRSAWHHGWNVKGLDTYAGLSAGAGFNQYSYNQNEDRFKQNEVIPVFGGFAGASYFVTPTFGFNVEAGRDITQIQTGIILKIK